MHMIVNYGESESYRNDLTTSVAELCSEHFNGKIVYTQKYLLALISSEIYYAPEVYAPDLTDGEQENELHRLECELHNRIKFIIQQTEYN